MYDSSQFKRQWSKKKFKFATTVVVYTLLLSSDGCSCLLVEVYYVHNHLLFCYCVPLCVSKLILTSAAFPHPFLPPLTYSLNFTLVLVATGLYYVAEIIEDYERTTRKVIKYTIWVCAISMACFAVKTYCLPVLYYVPHVERSTCSYFGVHFRTCAVLLNNGWYHFAFAIPQHAALLPQYPYH